MVVPRRVPTSLENSMPVTLGDYGKFTVMVENDIGDVCTWPAYRFLASVADRPSRSSSTIFLQLCPRFFTAARRRASSSSVHSLRFSLGLRKCNQRLAHSAYDHKYVFGAQSKGKECQEDFVEHSNLRSALRHPTARATSIHL